jgi:dipeptidyl aminopeptidase/acylaminoacyl peptidase
MTKKVRRMLLVVAALLFMAVAPVVVLYAIGYRPALNGEGASPIGVLLLDAIPRRVNVDVAEKFIGRTPRAVSNLPAGPIRVRFSKEGYVPWEKTLQIEPTRATEVRNVRLFPEHPDIQPVMPSISSFTISPNRSFIAAFDIRSRLVVINQEGESVIQPITLTAKPASMLWSPDNTFLLLHYETGQYQLVDITDEQQTIRALPQLRGAEHVSWDSRLPGRLFAHMGNGSLASFNITTSMFDRLLTDIHRFALSSRHIYAVTAENTLEVYTRQGHHVRTINGALEHTVDTLYVTPAGNAALLFEDGSLIIVDEDNTLRHVADHVNRAAWSPDGRMLLIQIGSNELYVYNVENERAYHIPLHQLQLVIRLSRPIAHAQWYAGGHHIIYQAEDEIIITEIDTRDYPVSYGVDKTGMDNAHIAVGEDGDIVYYLKTTGARPMLHSAFMLTAADRR